MRQLLYFIVFLCPLAVAAQKIGYRADETDTLRYQRLNALITDVIQAPADSTWKLDTSINAAKKAYFGTLLRRHYDSTFNAKLTAVTGIDMFEDVRPTSRIGTLNGLWLLSKLGGEESVKLWSCMAKENLQKGDPTFHEVIVSVRIGGRWQPSFMSDFDKVTGSLNSLLNISTYTKIPCRQPRFEKSRKRNSPSSPATNKPYKHTISK